MKKIVSTEEWEELKNEIAKLRASVDLLKMMPQYGDFVTDMQMKQLKYIQKNKLSKAAEAEQNELNAFFSQLEKTR